MFDVVIAQARCPGCGHSQEWRIQYKYGHCRQHEHRIGDAICWFDPPGRSAPLDDCGENVGGLVAVHGLVEAGCSKCGQGDGAIVHFRDNIVSSTDIALTDGCDACEQLERPSGWMRFWTRRVAGSANEDRLELSCRGDRWTVAVADGAGGLAGGAAAARTAVNAMAALEGQPECGETTLVVIQMQRGELWGASVGDSGALLIEPNRVIDLTAAQSRKPLLGSGACRPAAIRRQPLSGRLLVATDGLLKYTSPANIGALARSGDVRSAVEALIRAVTLPSGNLQDDVALALGERVS
ncbi:Hypothetical protein A7982_00902 [Minicystis rosea]|nr:Hypothetical protein A7982_00902 [Minicystis rosea]